MIKHPYLDSDSVRDIVVKNKDNILDILSAADILNTIYFTPSKAIFTADAKNGAVAWTNGDGAGKESILIKDGNNVLVFKTFSEISDYLNDVPESNKELFDKIVEINEYLNRIDANKSVNFDPAVSAIIDLPNQQSTFRFAQNGLNGEKMIPIIVNKGTSNIIPFRELTNSNSSTDVTFTDGYTVQSKHAVTGDTWTFSLRDEGNDVWTITVATAGHFGGGDFQLVELLDIEVGGKDLKTRIVDIEKYIKAQDFDDVNLVSTLTTQGAWK